MIIRPSTRRGRARCGTIRRFLRPQRTQPMMKARKNHPNTYDVNLVNRHDDNSAINTKGCATRWRRRSKRADSKPRPESSSRRTATSSTPRSPGPRSGPSASSGGSGSGSILTLPGANPWPACGNSGPCQLESFPHRSIYLRDCSHLWATSWPNFGDHLNLLLLRGWSMHDKARGLALPPYQLFDSGNPRG